jgi:hypothetical protein
LLLGHGLLLQLVRGQELLLQLLRVPCYRHALLQLLLMDAKLCIQLQLL